MKNISFITVAIFFLMCCKGVDSFYTHSHVEDIDVLPLIKPYRLWTPIPGSSDWHLDFKGKVKGRYGYISQTNVFKVNVANGIIYGHCTSGTSSSNFYFIVMPDERLERAFDTKEEWTTFLSERGVNSDSVYDVLDVYNVFNEDYKCLPWYEQVKIK